ncbi:MAG: hypothetical protein AB7J28_06115 [Hyphomonadaceae bacterium]
MSPKFLAAAAALALTALAPAAHAQSFTFQRNAQIFQNQTNVLQRAEPRFMAYPVSIHANDETGADWAGSDEVYAIFRDPATNSAVHTPQWGDVDTDETRYFAQANACLTPIGETYTGGNGRPIAWRCREGGVAGPFSFIVELWESDSSWTPNACLASLPGEVGAHNCADDLIARYTIAYSQAELLAAMPQAGAIHTESLRRGGYTFTWRVQRLPDVVVRNNRPAANRR